MTDRRKEELAFSLGGMGSASTNFYGWPRSPPRCASVGRPAPGTARRRW
ncbi:hypothetical protein SRB17_24800 [Streptomyces sp. RB17]|nr:hypothetical protein [Streptomyces sp. RB17]